ncbi:MAG: AraC family transcriptional regulator [Balneola sp.]|nr:MAG: AraC family transcriptional regulator [Balneola sp.]
MHKIENALDVLGQNITEIVTVSEWAEKMSFNCEKYFSTKIRDYYGKRAKQIIIEQKLLKIEECLSKSSNEIFYCIARELGFANEHSLYKFVKRHTGKTITELKRDNEKEKRK